MEDSIQVPVGLEACLTGVQFQVDQEGGRKEWLQYTAVKRFTNVFIIDATHNQILLGYKKRGFAKGVYNGFGGKVEPGETSLQAAHRELKEEAGIEAPLEHCGVLFFYQTGHEYAHFIDIYRAYTWSGEPTESDEMKPQWFEMPPLSSNFLDLANEMAKNERGESETSLSVVPLHRMWVDDRLWFPLLLSKRRFAGRVDLVDSTDFPEALDTPTFLYPLVKWWFAALD